MLLSRQIRTISHVSSFEALTSVATEVIPCAVEV